MPIVWGMAGVSLRVGRALRGRLAAVMLAGTAWVTTTASPAAPATAGTGNVEGHVRVVTASSRRLASAGAYPSRTVGIPVDHNSSELANVVVFLKTRAVPSAPMRAAIRQADEEFVPHVVVVTAGSTVDFPNDDIVFHNVFSLSRGGTFDLGRYPKDRSRSRVFDTPGLIKVFCHLHSQMSAIIRVFDHPYFAIPDSDGRFTIADVPAGDYDVIAWHERVGEVTLHARVGPGPATPLAFSLPLTDTP